MEKKTEIAKNISSGAEKVEKIETKKSAQNKTQTRTKKTVNSNTGRANTRKTVQKKTEEPLKKEGEEQAVNSSAKRESDRAKKRVELALKRKKAQAERAEKRKAEKAARHKKAEERKAEKRRKAEEKKAVRENRRKAAAEKRKARREELAQKRKAQAENRREKRRENRKKTNGKKRRAPGYGGWLAAVVSLGAITLALTTVVTLGAVDMAGIRRGAMTGYRGTLYEFVGVMENLDDDLDRVRVSANPQQQSRILTDLLVQARVAEADLEKLPIDGEADRNLTGFINRTAAEAERLLSKLRAGEKLSEQDAESLERLYETNRKVRSLLDKLSVKLTDKELQNFLKGARNSLTETLENIENATLPENGKLLPSFREWTGAGMKRTTTDESKKDEKIASETAEEKVREYFSDYPFDKVEYTGETIAKELDAYNFILSSDGGAIFAQVSEFDGSLIRFDYYKDCKKQNFDVDNAKTIAENFLDKLGYENMIAVRSSEGGATAEFLFTYESDGYVFYPESVKIKVCEERGVVSGFDASAFMRNKNRRIQPTANLSLEEAQSKLHESLAVSHAQPCVIDVKGREKTAYEFLCAYGEEQYVVYLDANTGNEISIVNLKNLR